METCLIIPDIHNKVDIVDKIINSTGADKIIFTGDFFDDFGDSHIDAAKTARWLKNSLAKPNRVHCFGNHDFSYRYPNNLFGSCSGFSTSKSRAINEIISNEDWDKMKFYHFEQGWFMSHAGLHSFFFQNQNLSNLEYILNKDVTEALKKAKNGERHWIYSAGRARGGLSNIGGLTWCDFDIEFKAIKGLKQVFGHTPQPKPAWYDEENLCLDTHLNHYAILKDGKITICNYIDL